MILITDNLDYHLTLFYERYNYYNYKSSNNTRTNVPQKVKLNQEHTSILKR